MKSETVTSKASFGVIGLGVMGRNLALNVEQHGFPVAVWNLEAAARESFLAENAGKAFVGAVDLAALVAALERPRRILMMVTAGAAVDSVLDALVPLLEPEDIVIDGGNTWYEDTQRREARLAALGLRFVGMGVSGGEEGARFGPSLMPGGDPAAYEELRPILEAIAAKTDSGPCVTHVGVDGAGHFSKMVHNGIEYADMQLLAEGYDLLKRSMGFGSERIATIFEDWNEGPLESFLVEISSRIFRVRDERSGGALVEQVLDRAGQKGTGRWTCQAALELGISVPAIAAALDARVLSSFKSERGRVAASFQVEDDATLSATPSALQELEGALLAAKVCAYAQGLDLLRAAGREYGWEMNLRELARIWKGGCIIRARLLDDVMRAYEREPALSHLILDPHFGELLRTNIGALRATVQRAVRHGIPAPALSASLSWFDAWRTADLPQNLTQAQRDAFGAHTYLRKDDPEGPAQHTPWLE